VESLKEEELLAVNQLLSIRSLLQVTSFDVFCG
jgi:hypothetical protein